MLQCQVPFSSVKLACPTPFSTFPTLVQLAPLTTAHTAILAVTNRRCLSIFLAMLPEAIVSLTAFISISFCYLEPVHVNITTAQAMQETRIEDFDKMITGWRSLLQQCGRPRYLESVYVLWTQLSQSWFMMEKQLWPEQPWETPLHLALPRDSRPLTNILLDSFNPQAASIGPAIEAMETFRDSFLLNYDASVHSDLAQLLADALLIFRTAEAILRLKQRCLVLQQTPMDDTRNPVSDEPASAPAASSSSPITTTLPTTLQSGTGEELTWY